MDASRMALFLMLGQSAERTARADIRLVPPETLALSQTYDLAETIPAQVRDALRAAEAYKLFFVFEAYLRELVVEVLSSDSTIPWWNKVPPDVKTALEEMTQAEETKSWMALDPRDKSALMTYPQLLRVIDECWKTGFSDVIRDKSLVHEARVLTHLRNTIAHMAPITDEETERVRQVMRDWFRMVAP